MGPLFNPFFWFACFVILTLAILVASISSRFIHVVVRRFSLKDKNVTPTHTDLVVILSAVIGIATFCTIGNWLFTDPSIPKTQPTQESLIGVWEVTDFSRERMQEDGGYTISTHTLTFYEDGTFELINMPDWWLDFKDESKGNLYSGSGKWEIDYWMGSWVVWLRFTTFPDYPGGLSTTLTIGDWNGERNIYYRIERDNGYHISFKKIGAP